MDLFSKGVNDYRTDGHNESPDTYLFFLHGLINKLSLSINIVNG